jgi:hypothetical protein
MNLSIFIGLPEVQIVGSFVGWHSFVMALYE